MKFDLQYVNDANGKVQAVQLPVAEWKRILNEIKKLDQSSKIKKDLQEAFKQVSLFKKSKSKKSTLSDFLNEI